MRSKMGLQNRASPENMDRISVPSDLSDDMWGEVPKY